MGRLRESTTGPPPLSLGRYARPRILDSLLDGSLAFRQTCKENDAVAAVSNPAETCPIAHPDRLYIGGAWIEPSSDSRIEVIAPATEERFVSVAEAQEADIHRAVQAAREAFDRGPWPRLSPRERARCLRAMGKKLAERAGDVSLIWPQEMGIGLTCYFAQKVTF
jgi:betaine-aldehyde dehydrogenase